MTGRQRIWPLRLTPESPTPKQYRYYDVEKIIEEQSCNIVGML